MAAKDEKDVLETNISLTTPFMYAMPKFASKQVLDTDGNEVGRTYGNYAESGMSVLLRQFDEQSEFCDATIVVQGQEVNAHWCILVACPYFEALHRSSLTGIKPDKIVLNTTSKEIVCQTLKYLYTGNICVNSDNVIDLITLSDFLQITNMKNHCLLFLTTFFSRFLNIENCVKLACLSSIYDCEKIHKAYEFMCVNLESVLEQKDILETSAEFVRNLVADEKLVFLSAITLFDVICKWTEHDENNRLSYFPTLLFSLEPAIIRSTDETVKNVINNHKYVCDCKDLSSFINDIQVHVDDGCVKDCFYIRESSNDFLGHKQCVYVIDENRWVHLNTKNLQTGVAKDTKFAKYQMDGLSSSVQFFDLTTSLTEPTSTVKIPEASRINEHTLIGLLGKTLFMRVNNNGDVSLKYIINNSSIVIHVSQPVFRSPVMHIRHVVVSDNFICFFALSKDKMRLLFANYNVKMVKTFNCRPPSVDVRKVLYIYTFKNSIIIGEERASAALMFDFQVGVRKFWRSDPHFALPACPFGTIPINKDYICGFGVLQTQLLTSFKDSLYAITEKKDSTVSVCKYNINTRQWTNIECKFGPRSTYGPIVPIKLPSKYLTCHFDCPHCKPAKTLGTLYDLDDVEDLDDDDDDLDYDDYDDYDRFDYMFSDMYSSGSDINEFSRHFDSLFLL